MLRIKDNRTIGLGASLVVQWLRIHLAMQEILVQSLVREDPTCRRATKSVHQPAELPGATTTESHAPRACAPQREKPLQ